tara:strand:+ start:1033 stop:1626 length:594 start_codon:yes stop_codon:yes gene_type:complete
MSLYQQILKEKPNICTQFAPVLPQEFEPVVYNNYNKECAENNKIYKRFKPVDCKTKNNLLPPRPRVRESTNPKKYDRHDSIYPLSSEKLLEEKDTFNDHYYKQNMGYMNDEAYLLNINKKADRHKTFNIHDKLVEYDSSSELDSIFKDHTGGGLFNERTSRKMIVNDLTVQNQEWCQGAIFNPNDFKEVEEPKAYNA